MGVDSLLFRWRARNFKVPSIGSFISNQVFFILSKEFLNFGEGAFDSKHGDLDSKHT